MTEGFPLPQAGARLGELVQRARAGEEHILLTEGDAPVAAIISVETLRELQHARDEADIALCIQSKNGSDPCMTHEAFMALLDEEDAANG